jgi:RNA polymerase sigma factor (TIGR02999 family)
LARIVAHPDLIDSRWLTLAADGAELAEHNGETTGITQLLVAWSEGHPEALDRLVPLLYEDLRRLAVGYMRRESPGHSLQPTALVHEAYVRLIDQRQVHWRNRAHFFGVAAGMMRRILVDHARSRRADKRGGAWARVTLVADQVAADDPREIDVLSLHESLERLAAFDPRQERIVELRYFGGLTIEEAAEVIGISEATVVREWTIAKAWLRADLSSRAG